VILAEILKRCVKEFQEYDRQFIVRKCIMDSIQVDEVSVDPDVEDVDASIVGADTEDTSRKEDLVRYDVVFDACIPETGEVIRLIINIEIQMKTNPGYPLITRAIYYLARLVSRQKGIVFMKSDYGKIRKVYSIWICPAPGRKSQSSITQYGFAQEQILGSVDEPVRNYDKMTALLIHLGDEGYEKEADIIRLLNALLSVRKPVEQRREILEKEFHIPLTEEIKEGMQDMCNFGESVLRYGEERGEKRGMEIGEKEELRRRFQP